MKLSTKQLRSIITEELDKPGFVKKGRNVFKNLKDVFETGMENLVKDVTDKATMYLVGQQVSGKGYVKVSHNWEFEEFSGVVSSIDVGLGGDGQLEMHLKLDDGSVVQSVFEVYAAPRKAEQEPEHGYAGPKGPKYY